MQHWCDDSLGTLHITFLAPKRIRFNSGPLSHCHRHTTAINTEKWCTVGTVRERRKPLIISYVQAALCSDKFLLYY